jgi:hypothetical protein
MIENEQVRALGLRVQITKNLINDVELDINAISEFLQLDGVTDLLEKMDSFFKLVMNTYSDNNITKLAKNIDFKNIFRGINPDCDQKVIDFFAGFLKLYIEDDVLEQSINERLEKLLRLNCDDVPDNSEIKRLYLYMTLLLALSKSPTDLALIEELNEKLQRTL